MNEQTVWVLRIDYMPIGEWEVEIAGVFSSRDAALNVVRGIMGKRLAENEDRMKSGPPDYIPLWTQRAEWYREAISRTWSEPGALTIEPPDIWRFVIAPFVVDAPLLPST